MMCYRDMTFCQEHTCKKFGTTCDRSLTAAIKTAATEWWGAEGAPICVFTDIPECYEAMAEE